ncbi:MAG: glycoside hydrolase family 18 protein [Ignavibacteriaceae bacterium]|nr:glycoside hydrolase family 18 protein [Ignavibacteriaceae bacterium]
MNRNKTFLIISIVLLQLTAAAQPKEIVAYYPEWAPALRNYCVKNIETSGSADKITILNYAFIEPAPDSSGHIIAKFMNPFLDYQQVYSAGLSVDGVADDSTQLLRGEFNQLKKLKAMHPHLKIIVSIGGWTGSTWFSDAALTSQSRELFVDDCINKFIYGNLPVSNNAGGNGVAAEIFDGFDIDWEFPVIGGDDSIHHNKNDRDNLSELISLFRKKLDNLKSGLLLTAAIPASGGNLWKFNLSKDQASIDWYNLMTYDFHGSWNNKADHHTNLFSSPSDTIFKGIKESFAGSILYLIDSVGVSPQKIVPGAAFYGKGWKVTDSNNHGLYQSGTVAHGISESDFIDYKNLASLMDAGYEYNWDNEAMAPYLFNSKDSTFLTFDDPVSVALKTRYASAHNLRGLMFWEISGDDSVGTLVNTIHNRNMTDIKIRKIHYDKKSPLISLTIPFGAKTIHSGKDVILNIKVIKKDAPIVKVEYFTDNISLGYNTKPPFSWVWFNAHKGKHSLSALAIDSDGNNKYSKKVSVVVK